MHIFATTVMGITHIHTNNNMNTIAQQTNSTSMYVQYVWEIRYAIERLGRITDYVNTCAEQKNLIIGTATPSTEQ